ncbi:RNA methyltransferase [Xylaria venustula]|nr:RNA methyltransferase [Xylaria venustula]
MRFPTSTCLLCRHSVSLRAIQSQRLALISSKSASSLSAIHNGLRQSQKSRPQGFNQSSLETTRSRRPPQNARDTDWTPPTFKLKRGKKDVTDTGPQRPSRRARFNDPNHSFGKRSLVYQMRHGGLREKMAELESRERGNERASDRMTSGDFMKDFNASTGRPTKSTRDARDGRGSSIYGPRPGGRESRTRTAPDARNFDNDRRSGGREPQSRTRTAPDARNFDNDRQFGGREPRTRAAPDARNFDNDRIRRPDTSSPRVWRGDTTSATSKVEQTSGTRVRDAQDGRKGQQEDRKGDDGPFLYGRSVVEAALKHSRRQLYKLYIYSGENRQNVSQDIMLEKLAQQKGVDVTRVGNDGQRMMLQMSSFRPHNGFVLEASPLPQLPLKALGQLSEDPGKQLFHVEIAHQSSEDAKINGTLDFVRYQLPKERNPFVLLLDGILDPGNLGGILRTAAFLGVNGIAITKGSSSTLTSVALKASAGASEVATLFSVDSAVDFLARSKENGWLVYAAVPSTNRSRGNSHLTVDRVETYDPLASQPTVLVIGSEGEGLTKPVRRQANHEVSIPSPAGGLSNVIDSLNKQSSGMIEIEDTLPESEKEDDEQLW